MTKSTYNYPAMALRWTILLIAFLAGLYGLLYDLWVFFISVFIVQWSHVIETERSTIEKYFGNYGYMKAWAQQLKGKIDKVLGR